MNIVAYLRERASCVEDLAQYDHELEYVAGLRAAADIIEEHEHFDWSVYLLRAVRAAPMGDYRSGMTKALDISMGHNPQVNLAIRLERLDTTVEALRTEIRGLKMQLDNPRHTISIPKDQNE